MKGGTGLGRGSRVGKAQSAEKSKRKAILVLEMFKEIVSRKKGEFQ